VSRLAIHDKYAVRMGIPQDISRKVNKIVDSFSIHDVGRRLPPKPSPYIIDV